MKEFYKYHGAGNDFILIDNRDKSFDIEDTQKIKLLCDRHKGIGADGLILMETSTKADCFMNYFNSDGSIAEMCGNGVRCLAKFFLEQTKSNTKELVIDTRAGIKKIIVNDDMFSVNMGAPVFKHSDFSDGPLSLENISFDFVSMGNPHAVGIVKNVSEINISEIGPKIENDSHFPNKINVLFVEKIKDDYFKVRVWERGSGATQACGSGACAVYAVLKSKYPIGKTSGVDEITLEFPGGNLYLSENEKGEIILRGPAVFVFKGEM
jgi:diaminopimelate epimerase